MCLGVPARVVRVNPNRATALVEVGGVLREVDAMLVEDVKEGDYVIVHAGAVISKIDEREAKETLELWEELLKEG